MIPFHSDIEDSPKWINMKSFSLDLHNHSMVEDINKHQHLK